MTEYLGCLKCRHSHQHQGGTLCTQVDVRREHGKLPLVPVLMARDTTCICGPDANKFTQRRSD